MPTINQLFDAAIDQQRAGNIVQAIDLCQQIIQQTSDDVDALHLLGLLLSQTHEIESAIGYLKQACRIAPDNPVIHNHLANALQKLNQLVEAQEHYRAAILLDSKYLTAHYNLGILAIKQKEYAQAVTHLQQIVMQEPSAMHVQFQLANAYLQCDQITEAIASYQKILLLEPQHIEAHNNLGTAWLKQDNYQEAIKSFSTVLRIDANHLEARNNLAAVLLQQNRYAEAIWQYQELLKLTPQDLEAHYNLGVAQLMSGELDEALMHFNTLLKEYPEHLNARINLAATLHKLHRKSEAAIEYQKVLQQQPNNVSASYLLNAITGQHIPESAPPDYVQQLFDNYANYFERHVKDTLGYQVPELLRAEISRMTGLTQAHWQILDLGCGTGLAGESLQCYVEQLIGVDISEKMLEIARAKNRYSQLIAGDLLPSLQTLTMSFDLIVAADVLVYFGDLTSLFAQCRQHLKPGGLLAFSTEVQMTKGTYQLTESGRYTHHADYLLALAAENHLEVVLNKTVTTRLQEHQPVLGRLLILKA